MIIRKPYALFIKLFKPIHIILSVLIIILTFYMSSILKLFSDYVYTQISVVGNHLVDKYGNISLYIIPIIILISSLLIFSVMFNRKKPNKFYIFSLFTSLFVLIVNIYTVSYLKIMEYKIVSVSSVKLIHDFMFISIIFLIILFIMFLIRGLGIDFRKFDFTSDLLKIDLSESDREEIEVVINVDVDEVRRKRKEKFRNFKYFFYEHKFLIIFISTLTLVLIFSFGYYFVRVKMHLNKEGNFYTYNGFSIRVNKSYLLNTDYRDNKITDNYLLVTNIDISSNLKKELFLNDFYLSVGQTHFKPVTNYYNDLLDLGIGYKDTEIDKNLSNYILVYEIPEKYINSEFYLNYLNRSIYLKPTKGRKNRIESKKVGEDLTFNDTLGDINLNIKSFDIKDHFTLNYNYCVKKECIKSVEYLKPSLNENYDKAIIKLDLDYVNNTEYSFKEFYDFFEFFGGIEYVKNNIKYYQYTGFELVESKRVNSEKIYIGVYKDIIDASSIKLIFNIRGITYEYELR